VSLLIDYNNLGLVGVKSIVLVKSPCYRSCNQFRYSFKIRTLPETTTISGDTANS